MAEFDFAQSATPHFQQAWDAGSAGLASLPAAQQQSRDMESQRLSGGLSTLQNWDANRPNIPLMAAAGAMMGPTKTGSFSESLGNAFTTGAGALQRSQNAEMDRFEKMQRLQAAQSALVLRNSTDSLDAAGKGFDFVSGAGKAYEPLQAAGYESWRRDQRAPGGFAIPGQTSDAAPATAAEAPAETADATQVTAPTSDAPAQQTAALDPDMPSPNAQEAQAQTRSRIPEMPANIKTLAQSNPLIARDWETLHLYTQNPEKFKGSQAAADVAGAASRFKSIQEDAIKQQRPRDLTAADKKQIWDSEDGVLAADTALEKLDEAAGLAPKAFSGFLAGPRARIGEAVFDDQRSKDTNRLNQILSAEAIKRMSETLKGASTDKEMGEFIKIYNSAEASPERKLQAINDLRRAIRRDKEEAQRRVTEMRGGTYFKPGGGLDRGGAEKRPDERKPDEKKTEGASVPPPEKREVGKVYATPKGKFRWTGDGWEKAN